MSFFRDAGTVKPAYDIAELLRFKESNIYTIAPVGAVQGQHVAEAHPDLAIRDVNTGGPWRDLNGVAWVNPMRQELWEPNIDLPWKPAGYGFDEIQYDYVRFPTDGDLTTMDFWVEYSQEALPVSGDRGIPRPPWSACCRPARCNRPMSSASRWW